MFILTISVKVLSETHLSSKNKEYIYPYFNNPVYIYVQREILLNGFIKRFTKMLK